MYEQFRRGPLIVTKYTGPLEEIMRIFQVYKSLGKVEKLSKRDSRKSTRILLLEYGNAIDKPT